MISPAMIEKVRRLVATGKHSLRKVARLTGVSRGTVAAVAHGTRRDRRRAVCGDLEEEAPGPIERCPECGALGESPCRACRVRQWQRIQRRRSFRAADEPSAPAPCRPAAEPRDGMPHKSGLTLELAGEHRRRYEEIHSQRMKEEPL